MIEDLRMLDEGRTLRVEIEPEATVLGEEALLRRVRQNLASNAVRYGDPSGEVVVGLTTQENGVCLRVTNDRSLIPDESRVRIFDRFVRLDTARDRGTGGTGLGLALAREIARAHGGELELLSKKRVVFQLSLPKGSSAVSDQTS